MADTLPTRPKPADMYAVHGLRRSSDLATYSNVIAERAPHRPAAWLEAREETLKEAICYCDSHIEVELLCALLTELDGLPVLIRPGRKLKWPEAIEMAPRLIVAPQHWIGKARVDVAVCWTGSAKKVVVECDGHDFHERTKEQVSTDNERDRAVQARGWLVSRFTGSDIFNHPFACSAAVMSLLGVEGHS
jgi:very-short-patch-repair endonuclease